MRRLVNRQQQIPGGMKFSIPEIKYNSSPWMSFDSIVNSVLQLTNANPELSKQHNWPVTRQGVENWVESVQVQICEMNGWNKFLTPVAVDPPPPKSKALSPLSQSHLSAVAEKVKKVWQGVKTINDWIDSGDPAVSPQLAERRAQVCVKCPLNGKGGLEEWFTKPASEAIRRQFEKMAHRHLSTSVDNELGTCTICLCPMKLKVHTPLSHIQTYMQPDVEKLLDHNCWIKSELFQHNNGIVPEQIAT